MEEEMKNLDRSEMDGRAEGEVVEDLKDQAADAAASKEETEEMTETEEAGETELSEEAEETEESEATEEIKETEENPESAAETEEADQAEDSGDAPDGIVGKAGEPEEKKGPRFFGLGKKKDKRDEKIEELTDQVRRQMAEFDNFRKRTDKEKSQMFDMGARDVIEKILPVVDNFERGLETVGEDGENPFVEGMRKVYKQLMTVLDGLGVKPIEAVGQPFDPAFHNAVMHCEDESVGENTVVQEFQKGYLYKDTVVRHSMVKVAN